VEENLRQILHQWEHFGCDMVVEGKVWCDLVIRDTGFGIEINAVIPEGGVGSMDFVPVLRDEKDLKKIRTPELTVDWEATERNFETLSEIFDGVLPVEKRGGQFRYWFAPWDHLVTWWGVTELYTDMIDRPEFVHRGIARMCEATGAIMDQLESQNALSLNNGNNRVGSGGLGFTDELPRKDFDGKRVRPVDLWGTSTSQIFSEVSPEMHEEFALQYERPWLARFGLNCYGCCEPLDRKIHILKSIHNLRRISMSRWVNIERAASQIQDKYIFSYKPNPAILAGSAWNPAQLRRDIREALEKTRGCRVELILKDITTVSNEPRRLWKWAEITMEEVEKFAQTL
jgi:hypothetical protein